MHTFMNVQKTEDEGLSWTLIITFFNKNQCFLSVDKIVFIFSLHTTIWIFGHPENLVKRKFHIPDQLVKPEL